MIVVLKLFSLYLRYAVNLCENSHKIIYCKKIIITKVWFILDELTNCYYSLMVFEMLSDFFFNLSFK